MKFSSKVILGVLVIISTFLRFYRIDFSCLWTEEIFTLDLIKQPLWQILSTFDFTPFPYYVLAHISYLIFGSDVSIRYPSAVAGILFTLAMYKLGEVYHDEMVGLYMAMLSVVILPFTYYAQYGRSYEISILAFVILLIFYIKSCRRDDWSDFFFWIIALVNLYIHLFSIIPVSILCLDRFIERRNGFIGMFFITIGSIPLFNTIYQVIAQRTISIGVNYGASMLQMVILIPLEFFNTLFLNVIVLATIGIKTDKDPIKWKLLAAAIITLIVGVILSNYTPVFPRYLMGAAIIILLFTATACVDLNKLIKFKNIEFIIFIMITLIFAWMALPNFESHFWVQQYVC